MAQKLRIELVWPFTLILAFCLETIILSVFQVPAFFISDRDSSKIFLVEAKLTELARGCNWYNGGAGMTEIMFKKTSLPKILILFSPD